MSYQQIKYFNQSTAGKIHGMCLENVRTGFGAPTVTGIDCAWAAWQHTDQHTGTPPTGLYVVVFFQYWATIDRIYKNWGHVGVVFPDGSFWSDGNKYASIAAYEADHYPRYVGYSTHINGVEVIRFVADPSPAPSTGHRLYFDPMGQTATFFPVKGGTFAMKIKDASYNWNVLENQGNRVRVNSASAGGDCWVYLKYSATGNVIPGRYIK